jgi:hypothetical protein
MTRVNVLVGNLCSKYVPSATSSIRRIGAIVVRGWLVRDAKRHFIACTTRRRMRLEGVDEVADSEVSDALQDKLDNWAAADAQDVFPKVQQVFDRLYAIGGTGRQDLTDVEETLRDSASLRRADIGFYPVEQKRSETLWLIVWGLAANDSSWLGDVDRMAEVDTLVERRLWKLERMRYRAAPSSVGTVEQFQTFGYPGGAPPSLGGQSPDHWEIGVTSTADFVLNSIGSATLEPLTAIRSFYAPPIDPTTGAQEPWHFSTHGTKTFCDRVIHLLHLEELAESLARQKGEAAANAEIRTIVNASPDRKGTFAIVGAFGTEGIVGGGATDDPYFELVQCRLDELVVGDHVILKNHPAYHGFPDASLVWRLENALVTGLVNNRDTNEPHFPRDLELTGHGISPERFGVMQGDLLGTFAGGLKATQEIVKARSLRPLARAELALNRPYQFVLRGAAIYNCTIEFRAELAPDHPDADADLEAFWARWLLIGHASAPAFIDFTGAPAWEYAQDLHANARFYEFPFVSELRLDTTAGKLTLQGLNLTAEKVEAVYLVSDPQRSYDAPSNSYSSPANASIFPVLGTWTEAGRAEFLIQHANIEFVEPTKIILRVPPGFDPSSNYWQPVLRIATPGASSVVDVRSSRACRWPGGMSSDPEYAGSTLYNVAYFRLFRPNRAGRQQPVVFTPAGMTGSLLRFYREHEPFGQITVLRPRPPNWFGQTP